MYLRQGACIFWRVLEGGLATMMPLCSFGRRTISPPYCPLQEGGPDPAAAAVPSDVAESMRQFVAQLTTPETELEQQVGMP